MVDSECIPAIEKARAGQKLAPCKTMIDLEHSVACCRVPTAEKMVPAFVRGPRGYSAVCPPIWPLPSPHSSYSLTANTYQIVIDPLQHEAAAALDHLLANL